MMYTTKYPLELRLAVVEVYKNHVGGYKRLAKIYGLSRDLVRFWVLDRKHNRPQKENESIPNLVGSTMKKTSKDPTTEKDLKDLRLQVSYYKKLSEILEAESKDVKKARSRAVQTVAQEGYPVKRLCGIAQMSRSTFYFNIQPAY